MTRRLLILVALLALGTAHATYFTPVQYYGQVGGDHLYADGSHGGGMYGIGSPIRGFDTSLGSLVGVTVSVYGMDGAGFLTSTNDDTSAHNVIATYNSDFTGSAPGASANGTLGDNINQMRSVPAGGSTTWTIAGNDWTLAPPGTMHVDSSYFSQYLGSGNIVPVSFAYGDTVGLSAYTAQIPSWSASWGVKVDVQYEYDTNTAATPEPCTLALLGLGLGGLVARSRRRKPAAS